jgi:hypothetical protein
MTENYIIINTIKIWSEIMHEGSKHKATVTDGQKTREIFDGKRDQ